ncbi:hypothetical protein Y032_0502g2630 [Ancylostoma ceylanicum]|uniref:Reverse transcriptase domain-containing protein n=1 Tax=Ancylostoma ceylanicum TaxID=53326 RepID=A0A016WV60_9BILA|nr:hypothetical protein Y032_0502g2630 [Ancylostoma ceylanicum]
MPRDASSSTRALLEKRRHMDRQANHVEYAVLNRLCRRRLAEDHANLVRSRLLDAAHRKRSLKMEKRALAENRLSIPCSKAPDGSRCSSGPEMENIMANFYTALYKSDSGQTAVLSPEEEVSPILTSEVRQGMGPAKVRNALEEQGVEARYTKVLSECYSGCTTVFRPFLNDIEVSVEKGSVIRNCDWSTFGVLIDGERLNHLRFAGDIVLITRSPDDASEMLRRLDEERSKAGLTINKTKTKISNERRMLGLSLRQQKERHLHNSDVRALSEVSDAVLHADESKHRARSSGILSSIVYKGVRQRDTVSPKLFTATLENVMRKLEWDNMVVRVDGRLLHYLHFADDIVLITPNISQAERMLAHFDDSCGKIGLRLNLTKKMFMRNGWVPDAPFSLNGTTISKCSCYVYLGRKVNMMNDLAPKLGRGKQATWKAYKSIEKVVKKTKITTLRAHPFNTTVLPALTYVSETWALRTLQGHCRVRQVQ